MDKKLRKIYFSLVVMIIVVTPLSTSAQEVNVGLTEGTVGFTKTFKSMEKPPKVEISHEEIFPLEDRALPRTGDRQSYLGAIGMVLITLMFGLIYLRKVS
ncbi:LPXTG cell wall anchor domain-containing protein [Lactococcus lactis]|uniref:LPXTG cell wall anchor domain-containing protein n=1 Tax=Lactococcus lactis TaxID=1358 RepID=A0A9X4S5C1_9LACT|nr:LPXTG cell wall anchor domain-containing protein [Lactococcus lactis]MDG4984172.1 LPXTG cell wall anchor domain-containing protein [Lactococcus lactis]